MRVGRGMRWRMPRRSRQNPRNLFVLIAVADYSDRGRHVAGPSSQRRAPHREVDQIPNDTFISSHHPTQVPPSSSNPDPEGALARVEASATVANAEVCFEYLVLHDMLFNDSLIDSPLNRSTPTNTRTWQRWV